MDAQDARVPQAGEQRSVREMEGSPRIAIEVRECAFQQQRGWLIRPFGFRRRRHGAWAWRGLGLAPSLLQHAHEAACQVEDTQTERQPEEATKELAAHAAEQLSQTHHPAGRDLALQLFLPGGTRAGRGQTRAVGGELALAVAQTVLVVLPQAVA